MPIADPQAFVFTHDGRPGPRARSLKEFVDQLAQLADTDLAPYLLRHDFSRWLEHVFRDCPLATHVKAIESRAATDRARDLVNNIAQAVRARYEMTLLERFPIVRSTAVMVLLSPGGTHGAVLDGFAHARVGGL